VINMSSCLSTTKEEMKMFLSVGDYVMSSVIVQLSEITFVFLVANQGT